ncbi:MAG: hypothetical protein ABIH34_06910 [Nanoarchaeota archaeon]
MRQFLILLVMFLVSCSSVPSLSDTLNTLEIPSHYIVFLMTTDSLNDLATTYNATYNITDEADGISMSTLLENLPSLIDQGVIIRGYTCYIVHPEEDSSGYICFDKTNLVIYHLLQIHPNGQRTVTDWQVNGHSINNPACTHQPEPCDVFYPLTRGSAAVCERFPELARVCERIAKIP